MLEIKVFETLEIADSLSKSVVIILEAYKKWLNSNSNEPFTLTVRKLKNKSPPSTLEINVSENIKTKTAFGQ